ncbi:MAG: hypothetical protein AAF632_09105 [Bacteroidota bacterium]
MVFLTDKHLSYGLFRLNILFISLLPFTLSAQSWVLKDSLARPAPSSVIGDTNGRLYLTVIQGSIVQYDRSGDTLRTYQTSSQEMPLLLPWQLLRIQAYFPYQQVLTVLDQNLNAVSSITLPETTLGNAALGADQLVWYISTDLVLKKYQPSQDQVTLATSLQWHISSQNQIHLIQEYQNRLYVQVDEQLLVFDLFGNFLSKQLLSTHQAVQFSGNELYYIFGQNIQFIHLYSGAIRSEPLPPGKNFRKILWEKEYLHGFSERFWYVYSTVDRTQ